MTDIDDILRAVVEGRADADRGQQLRYEITIYSDRLVVEGDPLPIAEFAALGKFAEVLGFTHFGPNEPGARVVMVMVRPDETGPEDAVTPPGETFWSCPYDTGELMWWDDLLDHIAEYEAEYPEHMIPQCRTDEYRAATVDDFDCFDLAEMLWWRLDDRIPECEGLYHDEGYPVLDDLDRLPSKRLALHGLAMAIRHVLEEHLDLSEAAAQPTGRFRVRGVDGVWSAP